MNAPNETIPVHNAETPPGASGPPAQGGWTQPAYRPSDPRRKSPLIAAFLSLCPGLGQVYVGYYQRGFAHILVIAATFFLMFSVSPANEEQFLPPLAMFLVFFWLYNIIDAGRRAAMYNYALDGLERMELPSDFKMPGLGGSIFGGVVLIVGGLIILSHTLFGVPLDWITSWWPVFGIAFGVYLLVKGVREKSLASDREVKEDRAEA